MWAGKCKGSCETGGGGTGGRDIASPAGAGNAIRMKTPDDHARFVASGADGAGRGDADAEPDAGTLTGTVAEESGPGLETLQESVTCFV